MTISRLPKMVLEPAQSPLTGITIIPILIMAAPFVEHETGNKEVTSMPFDIVEGESRVLWTATDGSSTYYKGQLVSIVAASKAMIIGNVVPLAVPAGIADLTNFQIPFGVVIGFNRRSPRYTTVGSMSLEYDTAVITQEDQLARDWTGAEGMYTKGDPQVLLQVATINCTTILRGPICTSALGTAPTVVTDTGGADTTGYTTGGTTTASQLTGVADLTTIYCRTGKNMGLYRTTHDTTTISPDCNIAFPYDVASGDTFVRVPLKQGLSYIYIAGPGLYIDSVLGMATNYFAVMVYKLDLRDAGKEIAEFSFLPEHFTVRRAAA
jgi:hypothetical protein